MVLKMEIWLTCFAHLLENKQLHIILLNPLIDGNPLNFVYFLSIFAESVEKKIEDPQGKLLRLIRCTTGEAQELVKHFINDKLAHGYRNTIELLKRQYGNPHRLLAAYRMEIKYVTNQTWGCISIWKAV